VPIVGPGGIFGTAQYRGLMTASAESFENGQGQCPPAGEIRLEPVAGPPFLRNITCMDKESVCIRHGGNECRSFFGVNQNPIYKNCLQHDADSRMYWREAFRSATAQTAHEWCRLLHLTRDRKGFDAASIPWPSGSDLAPSRTRTARRARAARKGPGAVVIEYEGVLRSDATWPVLSFVAYTGDFRQSARSTTTLPVAPVPEGPFGARPRPGEVATSARTISGRVRLCVNPTDTAVFTLWGWQDRPTPRDYGRTKTDGFSPYEPVLSGTTQTYDGPTRVTGLWQTSQTDDLTMRYRIFPSRNSFWCRF
jgi:hypothetical protein